jgi:hypothetical protein
MKHNIYYRTFEIEHKESISELGVCLRSFELAAGVREQAAASMSKAQKHFPCAVRTQTAAVSLTMS